MPPTSRLRRGWIVWGSTAAAFALMGVQGARRIVAISLLITTAATLLFVVALDSNLPRGPVEKLIVQLRR